MTFDLFLVVVFVVIQYQGLQLTACSPSSSAVRLEMGVVELELSNMKEDKVHDEDMTDGSIDGKISPLIRQKIITRYRLFI